jgi:hypothetical protein
MFSDSPSGTSASWSSLASGDARVGAGGGGEKEEPVPWLPASVWRVDWGD